MMRGGPTYDDGYVSRKMASLGPSFGPPGGYGRVPMASYMPPQAYAPMGPPRMMPRMAPSYYDYDYGGGYGGYGGAGYGGGYGGYGGGYMPMAAPPPPPAATARPSRYDHYLDDSDLDYTPHTPRYRPRFSSVDLDEEPSASKALQDHVDKMRIRLKTLAYSLDPSGPVPEIVIPQRGARGEESSTKKYSTPALEYKDIPSLSSRRPRYYPEDEHMKDNLRIKCLSQYKSTRTAAGYYKPKLYAPVLPDSYSSKYASKYSSSSGAKWDEPDTVYGASSDKLPYSKAITESEAPEAEVTEEKKERRRKKKSREPEETKSIEAAAAEPSSAAPAAESTPAAAPAEAAPAAAEAAPAAEEEVLDEKERKKLEKKKRKAEREAAAKAAMEAELEALAAAEAELAKLEAEGGAAPAAPAAAAPAAGEAPAKSE